MKTQKKNLRSELFESASIPRALAEFSIPMIISQLVTLAYNLADTYYLGRTGNPYMVAAASLVLPVFNITVAIANLFGTGGGSLISRLLGSGRTEEAKKVCAFSIFGSIFVSFVFALLCLIFINPLLTVLGASSMTYKYAEQYALIIIVAGGVPTVLGLVMANLVRSIGCSRQSGIGVSIGGVLNILLDPLFMFVILPKGCEVIGAAVATMISNVIVMIYFLIIIMRLQKTTVLTLDIRKGRPSGLSIKSLFSVGIPASLSTFLYDLTNMVIDMIAASFGDITVAAIGIVLKAERLPLNIGVGICQGMIPLIAYNYSSGSFKRMRGFLNFSRLMGLCISVLCIVMYEIFADSIMKLFIDDAQTVALGTEFIRIRCLATFFMFLCFHMMFFFQAVGQGVVSFLLAVVRQLIFNIPLLFLLSHILGVYGIVWTQLAADLCTAAVSFVVYLIVEKKVIQPRERAAAEVLSAASDSTL
jgi:multidrug efflux pump